MSDPMTPQQQNTLAALKANMTPEQQAGFLPPASGMVKQLPGIGQLASKVSQSPNYQALKPASFGVAGLAPAAGAAVPLTGLAPAAATLAAPAAIAYGLGKLIAPKWTDAAVGKIKDFISQRVAPLVGKAEEVGSAYETGMAKSIPGSRFLQSKLPSATQEYINQIVSQHPAAATAGQIGGTVGMMALPGANLLQGVTAGGKTAAMIGNAALNMAPFALGTGLDVGATTGDVGQGVKAGLGAEVIGTGVGAALSGISRIPAVNRFLAKIQMKGAGMTDADPLKVLRSRAKSLGLQGGAADTFVKNHMDDLVTNAADLISKYGGSRAGKEAMKADLTNAWEAHATLVDGLTGKKITTGDMQAVAGDSDLVDLRAIFGDDKVNAMVETIGKKIDGQGWTRARNSILPAYIKPGNFGNQARLGMAAEDERILQSKVAQAWHDHIDANADHVMEWAKTGHLGPEAKAMAENVPELQTLKAVYPAQLALGKSGVREAGFMSKIAEEASPTFARQAVSAMLQGGAAAGGALAGGPLGAIAANIGGRALGSIGGKLAEKGAGALAGALRGGVLPEAGKAVSLGANLVNPVSAPPPASSVMGPGSEPDSQSAPAGAQPIPNAAPGAQPTTVTASLPPLSPQEQAQAAPVDKPGQFTSKAIEARLEEKYARYVRQYGEAITFDQYKQAAYNATDGFNPMQPSTWKAMFDDKESSDRLYKGYLGMQKMAGVNAEDVLNHYTRLIHGGGGILTGSDQRREDESNARVVSALAEMTGRPTKEIDARLREIAYDKGKTPTQRKEALTEMVIREGGVDVPLLHSLGLW